MQLNVSLASICHVMSSSMPPTMTVDCSQDHVECNVDAEPAQKSMLGGSGGAGKQTLAGLLLYSRIGPCRSWAQGCSSFDIWRVCKENMAVER